MAVITRLGRHRGVSYSIDIEENVTAPSLSHSLVVKDASGVKLWEFVSMDHLLETSIEFAIKWAVRDIDYNLDGTLYFQKRVLGIGVENTKVVYSWRQTGATAGLWINTLGAGQGTFNLIYPTSGTFYYRLKRSLYSNVVTTANQVLGQRTNELLFLVNNGFVFESILGFTNWTDGGRFFAGLSVTANTVTANPSTFKNTIGFSINDSDAGSIYFMSCNNSNVFTRINTGLRCGNTKAYSIKFKIVPGTTEALFYIKDLDGGGEFIGTSNTNLPLGTVAMYAGCLASNAALTPSNSIRFFINNIDITNEF